MTGPLPQTRPSRTAFACVLIIGATLRFWNLTAGFPYRIGADEPVIAERALHILKTGNWNPHFFDYPGLYIYVQVVVGCARFLSGAMAGEWHAVEQLLPEHLFIWSRVLNATLGTATILVVYRVGLRWGRWAAVLAATLLAVWPNHVRESHFALTDVPLTLLTTIAMAASLRAQETGRTAWFAGAGAFVGLAAAVKYNGLIALVMPLAAAASMRPLPAAWTRAALSCAAAGLAFLVTAPYTLLALPEFLQGFAYLTQQVGTRGFLSGAELYLMHFAIAAGWPNVAIAGLGTVWLGVRGIREGTIARAALLVSFVMAYFYVIATKDRGFGCYLLPAVRPLCTVLAVVAADTSTWLRRRQWSLWIRAAAIAAILATVLVTPARAAIGWARANGAETTQDIAYSLLRGFIPPQSGVAIERNALRLPASSTYRVLIVRSLSDMTPEQYREKGITYVVASSAAFAPVFADPQQHAQAYEHYRRLLEGNSECLPPITPTTSVEGAEIRICRLQTP